MAMCKALAGPAVNGLMSNADITVLSYLAYEMTQGVIY